MDAKRREARRLALAVIEARIMELARPGYHGRQALELVLQDGVVDVVKLRGDEQTIKIDRLQPAA